MRVASSNDGEARTAQSSSAPPPALPEDEYGFGAGYGPGSAGAFGLGGDAASSSQEDAPHGSSFHAVLNQWIPQESDPSAFSPSAAARNTALLPRAASLNTGHALGARPAIASSTAAGISEASAAGAPLGSKANYKPGQTAGPQSDSTPGSSSSAAADSPEDSGDDASSSQEVVGSASGIHALSHPRRLAPKSGDSESSQANDSGAASQAQNNAGPTAATLVQPIEKTREVLPFTLSIPSAQDSSLQDDGASHAAVPQSMFAHDLPGSDPTSHGTWRATSHAIPPLQNIAQDLTSPLESADDQGAEDDAALVPPDQLAEATPVVHSGELAFAARLTPGNADPDSSAVDAPVQDVSDPTDQSSARAQSSAQTDARQADASTATSSVASQAGAQTGKSEAASLVEQYAKQDAAPWENSPAGEAQPAISARNDAAPANASSSARMEQWIEPPPAPASSSHDITIRVPDATERGASVRFVDRGGEIRVSVRTGDTELAQTLRSGLNDFVGRLDHTGIRAEVWRPAPAATTPQGDAQNETKNGSQNHPGNQNGSGRNSSGSQSQQDSQQGTNRPQWVEELETSIGKPTTPVK
jgi:hypothetical protein